VDRANMAMALMFFSSLFVLSYAGGGGGGGGVEATIEPADSKVHILTTNYFNRFIGMHDLSIIEFYAPWCGHCQHVAPVFREAAQLMEEVDLPLKVGFGKFDDTDPTNRAMRAGAEDMFNFTSYPSFVIVKKPHVKVANKEHWKHKYKKARWQYYGGGRDHPDDFVFYLTALAESKDPFDEERRLRPGFYKPGGKHETNAISELEPDGPNSFNTTVLEDPLNRVWIIEFYSDRCPYCKSLAPEIIKAAQKTYEARGVEVRFGAINSRVYHEVAEQHGVTSWPWVSSFYQGQKVEDMAGLGGWESVFNFAKRIHEKAWRSTPPPNSFLDSEWFMHSCS